MSYTNLIYLIRYTSKLTVYLLKKQFQFLTYFLKVIFLISSAKLLNLDSVAEKQCKTGSNSTLKHFFICWGNLIIVKIGLRGTSSIRNLEYQYNLGLTELWNMSKSKVKGNISLSFYNFFRVMQFFFSIFSIL